MTHSFSFSTAGRIVFGDGEARNLAKHLASVLPDFTRRSAPCLVVTGSTEQRARPVLEALEVGNLDCEVVSVSGEPGFEDAKEAIDAGRRVGARFVIGCGGGSAIDLAKATSALLANDGDILDYVEVIGKGRPFAVPALPCIAIPTTSGTGAEVTKNAVLGSPEHRVKVSLRHDSMLPRLAIVDPELTHSVPADVTAATGLDALTQCIEPYLSCLSNPLTDGIALQGIELGAGNLLRAFEDGADAEARRGMALCSLFGGLALANAKLGAVHGLAGPFGGMFKSPHGAVCARLLPPVLRANLAALRQRAPTHPALGRFDVVARIVTARADAKAEEGIEWIEQLAARLGVPALREHGMSESAVEELVGKATRASSMKGNPLVLSQGELERIVLSAL